MTMRVIPRAEWGARGPRGADVTSRLPWGEVVIHTEAGAIRDEDWPTLVGLEAFHLQADERQKMQAIEHFHVNTRGWQGIAYSFVIFPDGTVAEGRGWGRSGAHTENRNSTAAGFCLPGHGDKQPATEAQWIAMRWLIGEGIRLGKLKPNPKITGHRDYSLKGKTCPGTLIYPHIGRLRGITGPLDIDPQEDDMTPELQAALEAMERRLAAKINDAIASIWSDEATDEAHDETTRRNHGSTRGWLAAIAEKLGVTRDDAMRHDPTHQG